MIQNNYPLGITEVDIDAQFGDEEVQVEEVSYEEYTDTFNDEE